MRRFARAAALCYRGGGFCFPTIGKITAKISKHWKRTDLIGELKRLMTIGADPFALVVAAPFFDTFRKTE